MRSIAGKILNGVQIDRRSTFRASMRWLVFQLSTFNFQLQ